MRPLPLDLISAIIDQLDPNAATIGGADDLPPESAAIGLNFTPAIHLSLIHISEPTRPY